jgi:hypothetical protein
MDTSGKPCRNLNNPGGCKFGDSCAFSHSSQSNSSGGGYKGKKPNNQFQNNQNNQHQGFKKQHEEGHGEESHWEIPDNCPIEGITSSNQDRAWYWKQESAHVLNDMEPGPQWLFSCYTQEDGGENVTYEGELVFSDYCPEELAWETINAARSNTLDQFEAQFNVIASEYIKKKESIIANCKDQLTQCYPLRGTGQGKAMKMQHHENRFSNGAKNNSNSTNSNNNNNNNNNNNYNNQNNQNNNTNPNYKGKGGNKSFNYKNKSKNNSMGDCPW